jgi:integrase
MTPLRQRFLDDLRLRNYSPRTVEAYLAAVVKLTRHFGTAPDQLSPEQVRQFQLQLVARRVSFSQLNQVTAGLRFFYAVTLGRPDVVHPIAYARRPKKLPTVLAPAEVSRLFDAAANDRDRTLLCTDYALGLRISELVALRLDDLDAARGLVTVRQGKGAKDRLVPLSGRLLEELRGYWRSYRPRPWLFAGARPGAHLSVGNVQRVVRRAARRAGLGKPVSLHALRETLS